MGDLASSWHARWLFARMIGLHCFPQCSMLRLLVSLSGCGSSSSRILVDAGMNGAGGLAPPKAQFPLLAETAGLRWPEVDPARPAALAKAGIAVFDLAAWVVGTSEVGGIGCQAVSSA